MDGFETFYGFQFYDNETRNQQINPIPAVELSAFVLDTPTNRGTRP